METIRSRAQTWVDVRAHGAHAKAWLFAVAFAESSFSPLPPDILLIALLLSGASRARWRVYAAITTVGSVAGGVAGYAIGAGLYEVFGEAIVAAYGLEEELAAVGEAFGKNAFLAIFISAFTPIPYKVFTIAAGVFRIDLVSFIAASLFGRGLRFYLVAYLMKHFGERMGGFIFRYFNFASLVVALVVLGIIVLSIV